MNTRVINSLINMFNLIHNKYIDDKIKEVTKMIIKYINWFI